MAFKGNKGLLWQYIGLTTQLIISLGLTIYAGYYVDDWLNIQFPLAVWILPLLVIIGMIIKVIRDTSKNNHEKK